MSNEARELVERWRERAKLIRERPITNADHAVVADTTDYCADELEAHLAQRGEAVAFVPQTKAEVKP